MHFFERLIQGLKLSHMLSAPDYSSLDSFLNPRHGPWSTLLYLHRKPILDAVHEAAPLLKGLLLDVGCGNKPYADILQCSKHIGIDLSTSPHSKQKFDCIYDGVLLPFADCTYDSVMCTEVLEHCRDAEQLMKEISRVLNSTFAA